MTIKGSVREDQLRRAGDDVSEQFIGRGWAFPLRVDSTGGIALVSREQEIEEAIRLILGTSPGERPMRPEFGCRIHEYLFASADGETASAIGAEVRASLRRWEPRIDVEDVGRHHRPGQPGAPLHRRPLRDQGDQRPPQPRVPVLRDPGRRLTMALPVPNLDDRRFQDLVDEAKRLVQQKLPGVDRPQRVRPGRDADRAVRVDDRPGRSTGSTASRTATTSSSSSSSA